MGFLAEGNTLRWEDSHKAAEKVKHDGITQLLYLWNQNRFRGDKDLRWGDELEILLVHLNPNTKTAKLWTGGDSLVSELQKKETSEDWNPTSDTSKIVGEAAGILTGCQKKFLLKACWHPEFASYMVEATPGSAYDLSVDSLLEVEESMVSRRFKLQSMLPPNIYACTMSVFPMLGVNDFLSFEYIDKTKEHFFDTTPSCESIFFRKGMINSHPRFDTLVNNVRKRSGGKPLIMIPLYQDMYTRLSKNAASVESTETNRTITVGAESTETVQISDLEGFPPGGLKSAAAKLSQQTPNPILGQIYMDHFGFGMGNCCLQTTYLAPNLTEARYLYDQLVVLAPIFLALSGASPAFRGLISDTDIRWRTLEQGCDCRTPEEITTIPKSRYSSASLFISDDEYLKRNLEFLNDVTVPVNEEVYNRLTAVPCAPRSVNEPTTGMDSILAKHFAWLWVRDPMVIYKDNVQLDNGLRSDHFENIQSTNWNSVRFKVPPPSGDGSPSPIGWRVEFRTPDIQLTDFENAAIAGIVTLLVKAILTDHLNFYIPISKVDENFKAADARNSVLTRQFWFRNDIATSECSPGAPTSVQFSQMTMKEIFLGSKRKGNFIGLIPMLDQFVSREWRARHCTFDAVEKYRQYADLIRQRVRGSMPTNAADIRNALVSHEEYERDSIVTPSMNYSICSAAVRRGLLPYANVPAMYKRSTEFLAEISGCASSNVFGQKIAHSLRLLDLMTSCDADAAYKENVKALFSSPEHGGGNVAETGETASSTMCSCRAACNNDDSGESPSSTVECFNDDERTSRCCLYYMNE